VDQEQTYTYQFYRQVADLVIPLMPAISTEMDSYCMSMKEIISHNSGVCIPANVKQIYEHPPTWNWVLTYGALQMACVIYKSKHASYYATVRKGLLNWVPKAYRHPTFFSLR